MTEREWMEKIRESSEGLEIPESITPDQVRRKLKRQKNGYFRKQAVAAAAVLIMCGMGIFAGYRMTEGSADMSDVMGEEDQVADEIRVQEIAGTEAEQQSEIASIERRDAGTLYVVAKNYGEIYDMLEEHTTSRIYDLTAGQSVMAESATSGSAITDSFEQKMSASGEPADMAMNAAADVAKSEGISHSETNVQTEGVAESDIIQTDGSYIYVVGDHSVKIVDIRAGDMHVTGEVSIPLNSASDRVTELYVGGNVLNIIVERERTTLNQAQQEIKGESIENAVSAVADVYYMDTDRTTELLTYDISDRSAPKQMGSVEQDGYYMTSRKIGSIIYLFTEERLELPAVARGTAVLEDEAGSWIPLVDGKAIAADCIYLPAGGGNGNGMIVSSVDVSQPDKVVDNTMILNNYVQVYVSTESLYLYGSKYTDGGISTEIAKFKLDNGIINAVGATSAAGEVYDTFAINEEKGKLRLLTTDWSRGDNSNNLYLFDEELKLTGSLTGIAKGEQIYAARYFGNMAYFVTYRNTDPLFAVDLSDETEPKILSELEITGFSEYLHFWGADKLVGIGYETDPNTGRQEGIKLTMFDLSNPAELKTLGTCVIENIDYSPAFYNYKHVLADAEENLLGFAAETYGRGREGSYLLFSWEDGRFQKLLVETLADDALTQGYRGIFAGDTFYLVNEDGITSYDRNRNYQKKGDLQL